MIKQTKSNPRRKLKKYLGIQAVENLLKWQFVGRTEGRYVFLPQYRVMYSPIPKNASTTIQRWLYSLCVAEPATDINRAIEQFTLWRTGLAARKLLSRPDIFRFTVVRNPRNRLVSAFMSKVVRGNQDLLRGTGCRSERVCQLTFRSFVQEMLQLSPEEVEAHVRPQYLFFGNTDFDMVGRFESLDCCLREIATRCGLPFTWGSWGQTQRLAQPPKSTSKPMADWTVEQLRQLPSAPPYEAFYDAELVDLVDAYYRIDLERFGYTARHAESGGQLQRAA
jgi:hypothetical protein